MKNVLFLIAISIVFSCKSKQTSASGGFAQVSDSLLIYPSKALENTAFYIHKKAQLLLKTDSQGVIYPDIAKGERIIIEIIYNKKAPADTRDGNYREVFTFEIPDTAIDLNLKDSEMQQVKAVFARFCYCKDANRYTRVTEGNFRISRKGDSLHLDLDFKMRKTAHILDKIAETIPLKQ